MNFLDLAVSIANQNRKKFDPKHYNVGSKCGNHNATILIMTGHQYDYAKALLHKDINQQCKGSKVQKNYAVYGRKMVEVKECPKNFCIPGVGFRNGKFGIIRITRY